MICVWDGNLRESVHIYLLLQSQWDALESFCRITKVIKHVLILLLQLPMEFQKELERNLEVKQNVRVLLVYIGRKLKLSLIHLSYMNHQRFIHQLLLQKQEAV